LIVAIPDDSVSGRHVISLKLNHSDKYIFDRITYISGKVERKTSNIHPHVLSQIFGVKRSPPAITKFSKQFVPDLANCSLSMNIN
jgi:hypothetical protein